MKKENEKIFIDGLDKVILKALMTDARKSINEIAKNAGISGAAVHQRLKKLENAKLISGSQIIINTKAVHQLEKIPEVIECHYTTGNWSILIKILCEDNQHLMNVLNHKIQTIEGVSRTETFISLNQKIKRQIQL